MGAGCGIMESMTIPSALSASKQMSDGLQPSAVSTPQTANASRLSRNKKSKKKEQASEEPVIEADNVEDKNAEALAASEMPNEDIQTATF
jgi:hypothetical protein